MMNRQKSVYLVRFNSGNTAKKRFEHLKMNKNHIDYPCVNGSEWSRQNINDLKRSEIQDLGK
jgi:hypothetical protein